MNSAFTPPSPDALKQAMRIRLATQDDAAAIGDLIYPLAATYIAQEFSAEGAANLLKGMTAEAIRGLMDAGLRYHVAEEVGGAAKESVALAGVVGTRDNRHLYHLFVAEPFQRRGLARRLWNVAKQACLDAGHEEAFTVNSSPFAVEVYRRLGFVETSPPVELNGVVFTPMRSAP